MKVINIVGARPNFMKIAQFKKKWKVIQLTNFSSYRPL